MLIVATAEARGCLCRADEVNYLSGPGKGVILIKLASEDGSRPRVHCLDRRPRSSDRRDHSRRRADDQHRKIRSDRTRRQRDASCCQRGQFTRIDLAHAGGTRPALRDLRLGEPILLN